MFKKNLVWKECAPCDLCGKDAWGIEIQSCIKGCEDITTQLCANCIRELAGMCKTGKAEEKLTGIDKNEEEAIKLTHEFYEWARKQKFPMGSMTTPYMVIIWMLDRILVKED